MPLTVEVVESLAAFEARRSKRRSERLHDLGVLAVPANQAFLLDATRALDKLGHVRLLTLTAEGRTAAADLDYEYAGTGHLAAWQTRAARATSRQLERSTRRRARSGASRFGGVGL